MRLRLLPTRRLLTSDDTSASEAASEESAPEEQLPFEYEVDYDDYEADEDSEDDSADVEDCDLEQENVDLKAPSPEALGGIITTSYGPNRAPVGLTRARASGEQSPLSPYPGPLAPHGSSVRLWTSRRL
ncbi:hypothetical protein WJX82_010941 [Trebouxia sp. C0006]